MMMKRWMLMVAAALFALPAAGAAQRGAMQAWQDQTVADIEQMRDKFVQLAEAFPEDTWDWMPMEGTRSLRDVMVLMVAEGNLFPAMWGATPPPGAADGFGSEIGRVTPMSKADVIQELQSSLTYMVGTVRSMTAEDRGTDASWFGQETTGAGVVTHAIVDMHEHLGQAIAYARTNHIVPPWSM